MKRILLAIMVAGCTLAMSAQIVVTTWYDDAPSKKKTLKWNGHCFNR